MSFRPLLALPLLLELAFAPGQARAQQPDDTLNFAIEVAPGTQRVQPPVLLHYSKAAARENDVVGKGWRLEVGRIERSTRQGVPRYDPTDRFLLNGEELVPNLTPFQFSLPSDPSLRITMLASGGAWLVEQADGTRRWYGSAPGSTVSEGARTSAWLLSEIRDTQGDVVTYDYTGEGRQRHPLRIVYRDAAGVDNQQIFFAFERRQDPRVSFAVGFEQRLTLRLKQVDVVVQGKLQHRYLLQHTQSWDNGATLLTELKHQPATGAVEVSRFRYSTNDAQLCGQLGNAPCGPSFLQVPLDLDPGVSFTTAQGQDGGVRIGDVNGDGRADLVRAFLDDRIPQAASGNGVYLNLPGEAFRLDPRFELPFITVRDQKRSGAFAIQSYVGAKPAGTREDGFVLADFTGDGRADLLRAIDYAAQDSECRQPNTLAQRDNVNQLFEGTARGWPEPRSPSISPFAFAFEAAAEGAQPATSVMRGAAVADLNGDGLPDLVQAELVTGNQAARGPFANSWLNLGGRFQLAAGDATVCWATGRSCESIATISAEVSSACIPGRASSAIMSRPFLGKRYLDVNGDGLADFVAALSDSSGSLREVVLNTGGRFASGGTAEFLPPEPIDVLQNGKRVELGVRMLDVNGDGILDIVQASEASFPKVALGTQIAGLPYREFTGGQFRVPPSLAFVSGGLEPRDRGVREMDVNADGVVDLIRLDKSESALFINQSVVPDVLTFVEPLVRK